MYCIRPLPPSTLSILRAAKLIVTFISLVLAIVCLLIIRSTPSLTKQYARLLSLIIVVACSFDVFTQCIFDAQLIMPTMSIYRDAPIFNIPISAGAAFITWIVLILLHIPAYAACFIHRHQIIVPEDSIFQLRQHTQIIFLLATTVICTSFGYSYYLAWVPGADLDSSLKEEISSEWDQAGISRMDCFITYKALRNVWGIFIIGYIAVFVCAISLHTLSILRTARYMSAKTRVFHRMMLKSLVLVASVPLLFVLAPFMITFAFYKLLSSEIFTMFPMMDICTFVIAFHSTVHSTTLLLTTPIFRRRLGKAMFSKTSTVAIERNLSVQVGKREAVRQSV